jgi:hypothetical protein
LTGLNSTADRREQDGDGPVPPLRRSKKQPEREDVTVSPYRRRTADEPFDLEVTSLDELR